MATQTPSATSQLVSDFLAAAKVWAKVQAMWWGMAILLHALALGAVGLLAGTVAVVMNNGKVPLFESVMDTALPEDELDVIREALDPHRAEGIQYHALRTRRAGPRRFVSMHLLVPGAWTVQRGHDLVERIEARIHEYLPNTTITVHLEPLEDPRSWDDAVLDPVRSNPGKRTA